MERKRTPVRAGDIALLALSVIELIGSVTFFAPCGPRDDGSWMSCHWAGQAVAGLAAVLTVIALLHLLMRDAKTKIGLDLAAIPVALLSAYLPGNLIGLCMMDAMRCRLVTQPAVIVLSALIAAAAVFDLIAQRRK